MRYSGGKARIAKQLLEVVLADRRPGQLYVEPFCGGCNTLRHVDGPCLASDGNPYVIAMWRALQAGWLPPDYLGERQYYHVKMLRDWYAPELVGFVGGGCGFSGKFFGRFDTRPGCTHSACEQSREVVLKQAADMDDVEFRHASYHELDIPPGSLVYCDPPYAGTFGYRYSSKDFEEGEFVEWCLNLSKTCEVYVSEYTQLHPRFEVVLEMPLRRANLGKNGISETVERLFKVR